MARTVRGALVQASWTGDKESMIQKHEAYAHEAAKQGAEFILFQELFYGPYFCQVQDAKYYELHRADPGRADHEADAGPRQADRHGRGRADVRGGRARRRASTTTPRRSSTPTASTSASTARPTSRTSRASGRSSTSGPGNLGYPVFETAVGKIGVYICYDRHFPEGARALGLNGAEIVFIPSATSRGLSEYLWRIEQASHAVANGYFVGTINRVGIEAEYGDDDFYGQSYFVDPRGQFVGDIGSAHDEELIVRDLDLDKIIEVRNTWQFYRDRRPDAYADLTRPVERAIIRAGSAVWRRTAEPLRFRAGGRPPMQFGFTLKPDHTIERTLALTRQAEAAGFDYGWLFDSHVLWREPYPLLTLMAGATSGCASGPASPTQGRASRR